MSDPIIKKEGEESTPTAPTAEDYKKLADQLENLNKGIATYRDETKTAKEVALAATEALEAFKKESGIKDKDKVVVEDLSPDEQKKFDAYVKKNNLVTKDELTKVQTTQLSESVKQMAEQATNEFLEKHPEYDDDAMWQKVQEEFKLYRAPADIVGYRKLLERIHANLAGSSKERAKAEAQADIAKKNILSLSKGGGQGGDSKEFDSAVDAMQKKYPSLSREQIVARVDEIQDLYKDKK